MLCGLITVMFALLEKLMASDRFPYDEPSRRALVILIQETYPRLEVTEDNVTFQDLYFSPTINTPGRTYIEMTMHDHDNCRWMFRYRRLDLAIALGDNLKLTIEGDVTPRKIAEELNRTKNMNFNEDDVSFSDTVLGTTGDSFTYRLRAKADSLVWYGEAYIAISTTSGGETPDNARITESGAYRTTESGAYRVIEPAA